MTERQNTVKLSERLWQVARFVPEQCRLADIGSDHALLPVYLVQEGRVTAAIAGEINEGPLNAALRQVQRAGLTGRIAVRQGDGLDVIAAGEVDAVTIAGMGGAAIVGILERGRARLEGVTRLVLQPNVGADAVRAWLDERNWLLDGETVVAEDGQFYEIMAARPAITKQDREAADLLYRDYAVCPGLTLGRDWLLKFGPLLIRNGGDAFVAKWEYELDKRDKILQRLGRAETGEGLERRRILGEETNTIREVLRCLPTHKR